ncbi:GAF domain-containing protein [Nonomuraea sp. NPDC049695]|uniref:GAF domain-containing protein n=1 Tax=Nonomuraea sp. NPDC049695 TaxID=3154734 RepID=UPI0034443B32
MVSDHWLLVEVFGGTSSEPSVMAVGKTPKRLLPLDKVLRNGRYLAEARALIARVAAGGQPVRMTSSDGRRQLIGDPLIAPGGRVHGVYAWVGPVGAQPPPRDPAGAWYFNLTTDRVGVSHDLLDLYGVAPEGRRLEKTTAEAFGGGRLITNADEANALSLIVNSVPGTEHQATWGVRRDDGECRAANFACRVVAQQGPDGQLEMVARGITHDIGPAESTPSAMLLSGVLAQQVLAAEQEPGVHRAIVNVHKLTLLRWVDDPMPGVAWELGGEHLPAIHPQDLPLARRMAADLPQAGRVREVLRLRSITGGWIRVEATAHPMQLNQHTPAALVRLTRPEGDGSP